MFLIYTVETIDTLFISTTRGIEIIELRQVFVEVVFV